ncbi:hypothetical protein Taro_052609 [Colocasia esculenta]|uniref:Fe-S metabolism associated domain-containing protein n=1 Tax=Colocasia esculenta TaxID=4460 RepID=A0A843XK67_COLES|nr:hypothetical protein [Colocasia esculenta]
MSSIASHFHRCSPEFVRNLQQRAKPNALLFTTPPFLYHSPVVAFQRSFSGPRPSLQPIRSQARPQQRQEEQEQQAAAAVDLTSLPQNLREIISLFQSVSDPKAKYQQLLHYGGRLPPLDPRYKTDEHRVRGCVSQVWVRAFPDPADSVAIRFEADSDSALTKGLAALLVLGLSGAPATAIACVPPDFVHLLGLRQSLTPSRNNGFLNMLKLMQQKALELHAQGANSVADDVPGQIDSILSGSDDSRMALHDSSVTVEALDGEDVNLGVSGNGTSGDAGINGIEEAVKDDLDVLDELSSSPVEGSGGRAARIKETLERELRPLELELEDISYQHAGHAGVRGNSDGETHFNLKIVSKEFEGKSLVKRHRLVYDLLQEELQSGLHALSIVAKTPSEVGVK